MNWTFNPKNAMTICLAAFIVNAAQLVYDIFKTLNPNDPLKALDNMFSWNQAFLTVCFGAGCVYLYLKKSKRT